MQPASNSTAKQLNYTLFLKFILNWDLVFLCSEFYMLFYTEDSIDGVHNLVMEQNFILLLYITENYIK